MEGRPMGVEKLFGGFMDAAPPQDVVAFQTAVDAAASAEQAARRAVERAYMPYVRRLEQLTLVCHAMWTLLQERTGMSEEELLERVTELDLKDGVRDGQYVRPPVMCPCGAKVSRKFQCCIFCGRPVDNPSAFDTL